MAKLPFVDPSANLMDILVRFFLKRESKDFRRTLLVLPTQRLATKLLGKIMNMYGPIFPPETLTLESLVNYKSSYDRSIVSEEFLDLMIQDLIRLDEDLSTFMWVRNEEIRLIYNEMTERASLKQHLQMRIDVDEKTSTIPTVTSIP